MRPLVFLLAVGCATSSPPDAPAAGDGEAAATVATRRLTRAQQRAAAASRVPELPPSPLTDLPDDAATAIAAIASRYPQETRLAIETDAPPAFQYLCYMPTPGTDVPFHAVEGSPDDTRLTIYVNARGWDAMNNPGDRHFPVGSVIVKEKGVGGLGIMEKRREGWRYGYVSKDGDVRVDAAGTQACVACHEHGTVPPSVSAASPVGVRIDPPRDGVFLTAIDGPAVDTAPRETTP